MQSLSRIMWTHYVLRSLPVTRSYCDSKKNNENAIALAQRMKKYLEIDDQVAPSEDYNPYRQTKYVLNRLLVTKSSGLKIYAPKSLEQNNSHCVVRTSQIEINGNINDIKAVLMDGEFLNEWDQTIQDSDIIGKDKNEVSLHIRTKPRTFIPSRDFVVTKVVIPGAVVDKRDYLSEVIVTFDNSDAKKPLNFFQVRGNYNSILVLEPKGSKTLCTLVIEINPGGWMTLLLGPPISRWFVGERIASTLDGLKIYIEKEFASDTSSSVSIEEAARKLYQKRLKKQKDKESKSSILYDYSINVSESDLLNTIKVCESSLKAISASEQKDKADYSELRGKIETDLMLAKKRLQSLKS